MTNETDSPDGDDARLYRRSFLAASGVAVAGLPAAAAGERPDATALNRMDGDAAVPPVARHELNDDGMANAQTNTPPFCPRLVTYDGRQYTAYWDEAGDLHVAARDLPDGEWIQNAPGIEIGERDGHWTPAVGVGPEGHVFLCYNTRGSVPLWRRTTDPADITEFGPERVGMTGQNEDVANYPEFTRLLDGTLLFGYRQGSSGDGDWMLDRWNPESQEWEPLQHPLTSGEFEGETYNSYHWNLTQSPDGVLHYAFCWRGTGGVQTNTQLSYARSPDGGETWTRSDGTPYDLPITKGTAEVIDPIDENSDFINQGWISYDPTNGAPHVAYYRDDADGHTQIFHAWLADGEWRIEPVTNRSSSVDFGGGGVIGSPISRMGIVLDDDHAYVVSRDFERGGWPALHTKADGEWSREVIYERNLTYADMQIDPYRWRRDRILSFIDQQQTIGGVPWAAGTLIAVTDVDPARFGSGRDGNGGTGGECESDGDPFVTFASTDLVDSASTTSDSFADTPTALAFSETTIPGTPAYARADVTFESPSDGAAARVKIQDDSGSGGSTTGGTAAADDDGSATTEWVEVPPTFRAGFANVQIRSDGDGEAATVEGTLELAYRDPPAAAVEAGEEASDDAPRYMVPQATTGLREESPVSTTATEYEDTPTTVGVDPSASGDTYVRLTARLSATRDADAPPVFDDANWIWYPGENATSGAPAETRYFARGVSLSTDDVESATLVFTADDEATAFLNGQRVAASEGWDRATRVDVADRLREGENRLAVEATNAGSSSNPAGLLARLEITPAGGEATTVVTDGDWRASRDAPDGWTEIGFDDSAWSNAEVLGAYGIGPWNEGVVPPTTGEARLALRDDSGGSAHTPAVTVYAGGGSGIRTTGWVPVPSGLGAGDATLQIRAAPNSTTRVSAATLAVADRTDLPPEGGRNPAVCPPTDPDGDGLYEDVDGDGEANYDDAVDLFGRFDDSSVQDDPARFDFNGNGRLDFDDIVELFERL